MKITVIGAGPVGLVTGLVFSAKGGHRVTFVDHDSSTLKRLQKGKLPFYEKGLSALLKKSLKKKLLKFSTTEQLNQKKLGRLSIVCVGTQSEGQTDITSVKSIISKLAQLHRKKKGRHFILIKSTLPPQTFENELWRMVSGQKGLHLMLNPEFLREGEAIDDFLNEKRILIGAKKNPDERFLKKLFCFQPKAKFYFTSPTQAEYCKFVSNSFFANLISLANDWARVAEKLSAVDLQEVVDFLSVDGRLLRPQRLCSYLRPGLGFGGSCLNKDVQAFEELAKKLQAATPVLSAILPTNLWAQKNAVEICDRLLSGVWKGKRICVLGLSFKPQTSDTRSSVALSLIAEFLRRGAQVRCHDFHAQLPAELQSLGASQKQSWEMAMRESDLCILASAEKKYRAIEEKDFLRLMTNPVVFDGRGILDGQKFKKIQYVCVGQFLSGGGPLAQANEQDEKVIERDNSIWQ